MLCDHCGFDCTTNGIDMSMSTYRKALRLDDQYVYIGGGEPTIHPKFNTILMEAISECKHIGIITNGKKAKIALLLAKLTKRRVINARLSQDIYHEPINNEVIHAFENIGKYTHIYGHDYGYEAINITEDDNINNSGRAKINNIGTNNECMCPSLFVLPTGEIKPCGCLDAPIIGHVDNGYIGNENLEKDTLHYHTLKFRRCHKK